MSFTYKHTIYASFTGYIVQAIINNFIPLLFLTFRTSYGIPLSKITLLVTFNFGFQLLVDLLAAGFVDKIGYRVSIVAAHVFAAAGLISLTFLPQMFADPFYGLLLSVLIYAVGGGLLEVLVSPIVEACPTDNKESVMSLLHSFYCWGHVGVVLISTLFFAVVGIENWRWLALFWALVPLVNTFFFSRVPIRHVIDHHERSFSLKQLLANKVFWIMVLMMIAAGASEQAVSQWASAFAEMGLGVDKAIGDLTGPMMFAVMMGVSRLFYGKYGEKIKLQRFMVLSALVCFGSYLVISLSPWPFVSLIGCAICGLSVGIMWPGSFSTAARNIPLGGTMMFAFLALAGDVGCAAGPTLVGMVSSVFDNDLKKGILTAIVFPVLLLFGLYLNRRSIQKEIKA
ncbi:MAG: MFS transporter [Clostridiaceae bacterium]|nr:MFS transporter [Clostridiaceae bacterium]